MTMTREFGLDATQHRVEEAITSFIESKERGPQGDHLAWAIQVLKQFLGGGKRVRPLYCHAGWLAAAGNEEPPEQLMEVSVGLEFFHALALLHDDVIDRAEFRRLRPAAHRLLAGTGPVGDEWFGISAAILLGDLCEAWSAELLMGVAEEGVPRGARDFVNRMRAEMLTGQLMDISRSTGTFGTVDHALQVIYYKTSLYTVKRPLQIGAAMAGGGPEVLRACADYARYLGEAFQLLDDLEDIEPPPGAVSNAGNDLREGKKTAILALAGQNATEGQLARLRGLLGRRDLDEVELAEARRIIVDTGATRAARRTITVRRRQALEVLDRAPFHPEGRVALREMADRALPGIAQWSE
ncbi:polyprenyl synthetase family protein [Allokutzneria sp. NRRL B-24872]|uniref:polyprenyl synthetase family protein n=1 Tax=Allokutzneria sp. NRRL B-24872 TaxID=1137961 RepID=UPI000A37C0E5|nr:polyprenyl synthetase family protein [Allokutzneria sp. NRRL B-24872]